MKTVTVNKKHKLYVIQSASGNSCFGFHYVIERRNALAHEINRPDLKEAKMGSVKAYNEFRQLITIKSK